ncbi:MAG: ABC transporter substrate-binding protein [Acidimicrobiales bacterium]
MVDGTLASPTGLRATTPWAIAPLANVMPPLSAVYWWTLATAVVAGGTVWALHRLGRRRPPILVATVPVVLLAVVVAGLGGTPLTAALTAVVGAGVVALGWRRGPRTRRARSTRATVVTGVAFGLVVGALVGVGGWLASLDAAAARRDQDAVGTATPISTAPADGGHLVIGLTRPVSGFDPSWDDLDGDAWAAATLVYDPLAAVGTDGAVHPDLAAGFDHDPDLRTWRIRLRPDVRFRDGTPCDAAAVAANLDDRRTGPRTAAALADVASVRVVDPLTVEVTTAAPWARFPAVLTGPAGLVAAPSTLGPAGRTSRLDPMGTGRYGVRGQRPDGVTLQRVGTGWRRDTTGAPLPGPATVTMRTLPSRHDREQALAAADLDVLLAPGDPEVWARAADGDLTGWRSEHGARVTAITFDPASGPFRDPRLREAADLAIDRTALVGSPTAATTAFEPTTPITAPPVGTGPPVAAPAADPARAAQVRSMAGGAASTPVVLAIGPGEDDAELGRGIADAWRAAGFAVTIRVVEPPAAGTSPAGGTTATATAASAVASPAADATLVHIATGPDVDGLRPWLLASGDPELRAALDGVRATDDDARRREQWDQAQAIAARARPVLWLTSRPATLASWRWFGIGPSGVAPDGRPHLASALGTDGDDLDPLGTGQVDLAQAWRSR